MKNDNKVLEAKDSRINIRVTGSSRQVLESAARAKSQSLTEFIISSALEAADNEALDQRIFDLDPKAMSEFEKYLKAPAKNSKGLKRLLSSSTPWS